VEVVEQTLTEAEELGHPVTLGFSLLYAASTLLRVGRWSFASEVIERLLVHSERHGLEPYHAVGLSLRAELTLRNGDVSAAIALQRACLETVETDRHRLLLAVFIGNLAEGLGMSGQWAEALAVVDQALGPAAKNQRSADDGHFFHTPELLRIKAQILSLQSQGQSPEVQACLMRALEIARHQGALTWELRVATDLAELWRRAHRQEKARELLAGVYARFTEGFGTPDLVAARRALLEIE
jgi:tetratricopeptide (TPR) repeat protein